MAWLCIDQSSCIGRVFSYFPSLSLCSLPLCSSSCQPPLSYVHCSPQQMRGMSATTVYKQEQLHEDALQQQQSPHHTRNAHDHDVWTTCVESSGDAISCMRACSFESPVSLATSFVLSHFLAHTGFRISASSSRRPIVPRPRRRPGALPLPQLPPTRSTNPRLFSPFLGQVNQIYYLPTVCMNRTEQNLKFLGTEVGLCGCGSKATV